MPDHVVISVKPAVAVWFDRGFVEPNHETSSGYRNSAPFAAAQHVHRHDAGIVDLAKQFWWLIAPFAENPGARGKTNRGGRF